MSTMILERYELAHRLGRGGMGEVWSARDHSLDRQIALKFMHRTDHQSAPALREERFRREARYTARLGHPGVPAIHDVGKLPDGRLYLVMELVKGDTLTKLLKEHGSCPVDQALSITEQIASVLAAAHRSGLVHRDLKPANLMLTPSAKVKVLDFGIAAALTPSSQEPPLTSPSGVVGTPGFISPEQAVGQPATDRSDLYALGCVLYEILTGRPPFRADTPLAVAYQHVYEVPPPIAELKPGVSDALAALVMQLLAKEPQARPSAGETVVAVRAMSAAAEAAARRTTTVLPRLPGGPTQARPAPDARPASASSGPGLPPHSGIAPPPHSQSALPPAPPPRRPSVVAPAPPPRSQPVAPAPPPRVRPGAMSPPPSVADYGSFSGPEEIQARLDECRGLLAAKDYSQAYENVRILDEELWATPAEADELRLDCRTLLALSLAKLGRTAEALKEYEGIVPRRLELFGPTDLATQQARLMFSSLLGQSGRYAESFEELNLLRIDLKAQRPDDPRIVKIDDLAARLRRLLTAAQRRQQ
ncbi:serine/threonine-protein kinase [Streptomyces sp. NPDC057136]|uniref:serine/threonine-protein kinase n=1 Tax=Streptomyces sp. NPDC057136 TaxID=3346029 RepID=UPI00362A5007